MPLTRSVLEERQEVLRADLRGVVEHLRVIEGALQQIAWDLEQIDTPEERYNPVTDEAMP
jgi:hypothetical protein